MVASFILNPCDVIKTRLQTQNTLPGVHAADLPYKGFWRSLIKITAEEGFAGLMRGITASMMREASYSSLRLGLYDPIKGFFAPAGTEKHEFGLLEKILAGGLSGAIGSAIANPTDLIKIRFQSVFPGQPRPYKHTLDAFFTIFKTDGLAGLYRGVTPTIVRASVLTSAQLATYDHTKRYMIRSGFGDDTRTHLTCSVISGFVAATATNPFDVIKSRIMSDAHGRYRGPWHCMIAMLKSEGPRSFMKGWSASFARLGPHFCISMPLLELIRQLLGIDTV